MDGDRQTHWESIYRTRAETDLSWFQANPAVSLGLIAATGLTGGSIVDIGGGASRLVDLLLDRGFEVTVLDLSEGALAVAQARLGPRASTVRWQVADVTQWRPSRTFDIWHDRAVFHFLSDPEDRAAYAGRVDMAVRPGGHVIIGTFALDGPERCSGLPVVRHDAKSLGEMLGPSFALVESRRDDHHTPTGAIQHFQFSRFRRIA